jgi:hypothetical protein
MNNVKNTQQTLERFRDYVIQQSRSNLTKGGKNDTKSLYNEIKGDVFVGANSIGLNFSMPMYGQFQDKGVKGKDPSKVSKNAKIKGQQAPNSDFKFGSGNYKGQWSEFTTKIEGWAKRKNIRLRDEKGKFKQGNYKTIANVIARNIYNRGIRPSLFFTTPFEAGYKKYIDTELIEAFGLDVESLMISSLKDIK